MAELANGIIYGIEDKPPIGKRAVLALQHVLTMFGSTVSVPLLLGPAMNMAPSEIVILVSSVMLCSGNATGLQVTIGSRLPIVQGVWISHDKWVLFFHLRASVLLERQLRRRSRHERM